MLDPAAVIIREARPISLVAMFLIVSKLHAIHGWDAFLEVFGNPSIFAELPPGTSVEDAARMTELVRRLVSDGRGTVPSGTKFTTVETGQNNCAAFMERARWCKEAIITVACGGQLTVLAESGSGTLAGNAHADSFESLCAGTAASISAAINKQFTRRLLAEKWPDAPALAKFTLAPEPADERADMADLLGKLTAAGYALESDEAASELAHLPLRRLSTPQPGMPGMGGGMPAITNAARATTAPAEEPALTPAELAAFESLKTPNLARMEQHRRELEAAMRQAADLPAEDEEEAATMENTCNQFTPDPALEDEDVENKKGMPRECGKPGHCKTHSQIPQGVLQHAQKGGRGSKGNPEGKDAGSIPSNLPANATDGELEGHLKKALDATDAHSGNQKVTRGKEAYNLTQERSDHRRKHKGQGSTNEAIAKTLAQGNFEKDGTDATAYHKQTKVIKRTNPNTGETEIRTAYFEPNYRPRDKKKSSGQEPEPTDR